MTDMTEELREEYIAYLAERICVPEDEAVELADEMNIVPN